MTFFFPIVFNLPPPIISQRAMAAMDTATPSQEECDVESLMSNGEADRLLDSEDQCCDEDEPPNDARATTLNSAAVSRARLASGKHVPLLPTIYPEAAQKRERLLAVRLSAGLHCLANWCKERATLASLMVLLVPVIILRLSTSGSPTFETVEQTSRPISTSGPPTFETVEQTNRPISTSGPPTFETVEQTNRTLQALFAQHPHMKQIWLVRILRENDQQYTAQHPFSGPMETVTDFVEKYTKSTKQETLYINMAIIACEIRVRDSNTQEAVTAQQKQLASSVQAICQNNREYFDSFGHRIDKYGPCIRGGAQEAADQAEKLAAKQATPELCVIGSSGHTQMSMSWIRQQFRRRAIEDASTYLPAALDELKRRRAALP